MKKWLVLISVGLMIVLVNLDTTIVSVALAAIAKAFNTNLTTLKWVFASYLLAITLSFTVMGRLADLFGRRRLFLIGAGLFTLASLGCGLAPSLPWLLVFRFIQGVGFAGSLGLALVLIRQAFPPEQQGFATGAAILLTGTGQALGPTLGGILLSFTSWRWVFLINVPLGVVCIALTLLYLEKDKGNWVPKSLHVGGVLLFVLTLLFLNGTFTALSNFPPLATVLLAVATLVLFGLFYQFNKKAAQPLVSLDVLHHKEYLKVVYCRFTVMFVFMAQMFLLPLFFQNVLGFSVLKTGLTLLLITVSLALFSVVAGKMSDRVGFKWPILISIIVLISSCVLFLFVSSSPSYFLLVVCLLLFGAAIGLHIPSTVHGALEVTPKAHAGTAVGLFFTLAFVGATVGVSVATELVSLLATHAFNQAVVNGHLLLSSVEHSTLMEVATGVRSVQTMHAHISGNLLTIAENSFLFAYRWVLASFAILLLTAFLVSCFIKKHDS